MYGKAILYIVCFCVLFNCFQQYFEYCLTKCNTYLWLSSKPHLYTIRPIHFTRCCISERSKQLIARTTLYIIYIIMFIKKSVLFIPKILLKLKLIFKKMPVSPESTSCGFEVISTVIDQPRHFEGQAETSETTLIETLGSLTQKA